MSVLGMPFRGVEYLGTLVRGKEKFVLVQSHVSYLLRLSGLKKDNFKL